MFKNLKTVIATLAVFAMTIGSGFAMDNNPPTEPVKAVVETEIVASAQPSLNSYGYMVSSNQCIEFSNQLPDDCTTTVSSLFCTVTVGGISYNLHHISRATVNDPWICGNPLYKIPQLN